MNDVSLTGRLTRDPELITTAGGTEICNARLAVDRRGQDGAVFVDVKCFGKQATAVAKHKGKGDQVAVSGRLELDEWETEQGKRSRLYVVAERVGFLGRAAQQDAKASEPEPTTKKS